MEEDSCDDDEHGPAGVGVGVAHVCEAVHDVAEGESDEDDEDEDEVGDDRLEGLIKRL